MKKVYNCFYCKTGFPIFNTNNIKIPKRTYLRPGRRLLIRQLGLYVCDIGEMCFKCESKIFYNIRRKIHKKRGSIKYYKSRSEYNKFKKEAKDLQWLEDPNAFIDGPGPLSLETFKKETVTIWIPKIVGKHYGDIQCCLCEKRTFDRKRFHKKLMFIAGLEIIETIINVCPSCLDLILKDIKKIL